MGLCRAADQGSKSAESSALFAELNEWPGKGGFFICYHNSQADKRVSLASQMLTPNNDLVSRFSKHVFKSCDTTITAYKQLCGRRMGRVSPHALMGSASTAGVGVSREGGDRDTLSVRHWVPASEDRPDSCLTCHARPTSRGLGSWVPFSPSRVCQCRHVPRPGTDEPTSPYI